MDRAGVVCLLSLLTGSIPLQLSLLICLTSPLSSLLSLTCDSLLLYPSFSSPLLDHLHSCSFYLFLHTPVPLPGPSWHDSDSGLRRLHTHTHTMRHFRQQASSGTLLPTLHSPELQTLSSLPFLSAAQNLLQTAGALPAFLAAPADMLCWNCACP